MAEIEGLVELLQELQNLIYIYLISFFDSYLLRLIYT